MLSSERWTSIELGTDDDPITLIKASFSTSGYNIQITDLSRVWSEQLTRQQLITKATDSGCEIDPTEDDQCLILLSKIEDALGQTSGGSASLQSGSGDSLSLRLLAPLPQPLGPLTWTLTLQMAPQSSICTLIVQPLLLEVMNLQDQVSDLISEIEDRDRVILKTTDRLETAGHDLTAVFPGFSRVKKSSKQSQREQLSRHVRGLGEFDRAVWNDKHEAIKRRELTASAVNLVAEELPTGPLDLAPTLIDHWWRYLDSTHNLHPEKSPSTLLSLRSEPIPQQYAIDQGDFQRQPTPVRHVGPDHASNTMEKASRTNFIEEDEEATADEEDLGHATKIRPAAGPSELQVSNQQSEVTSTRSTLESPRATDATTRQQDSSGVPRTSFAQSHIADATHVRSHDDSRPKLGAKIGTLGGSKHNHKPVSHDVRSNVEHGDRPLHQKPKMRLGRLGGKLSTIDSTSIHYEQEPQREDHSGAPSSNMNGPSGCMRRSSEDLRDPLSRTTPSQVDMAQSIVIGNPKDANVEDIRGRTLEADMPPVQRENSADRANRRRDELRHEIESKSKAPVKKKRKF